MNNKYYVPKESKIHRYVLVISYSKKHNGNKNFNIWFSKLYIMIINTNIIIPRMQEKNTK